MKRISLWFGAGIVVFVICGALFIVSLHNDSELDSTVVLASKEPSVNRIEKNIPRKSLGSADEASPVSQATLSTASRALMDAWGSEEADQAALFEAHQKVLSRYGSIFEFMKWGSDTRSSMVEFLTQKTIAPKEYKMAYKRGELSYDDAQALMQEEYDNINREIRKLLGEEDYQIYRRMEYSLDFEGKVKALASQLTMVDMPLSEKQQLAIQVAIGTAFYDRGLPTVYDPGTVSTTVQELKEYALARVEANLAAVEMMEGHITDEQASALNDYLSNDMQAFLLSWKAFMKNYNSEE